MRLKILTLFFAMALVAVGCSKSSNNKSSDSGKNKPGSADNPTPPPEPICDESSEKIESLIVDGQEFHFLISKNNVDEFRITFKEILNAKIPLKVHLVSASQGFLGKNQVAGCQNSYDMFKNPDFTEQILKGEREIMDWSAGLVSVKITEWIDKSFNPENTLAVKQILESYGWDNSKRLVIQYPEAKELDLAEDNFWFYAHKTPNRLLMILNRALEITLADYCGILLSEASVTLELPQSANCQSKTSNINIIRR